MEALIPKTYQELLAKGSNYSNIELPKVEEIIMNFGIPNTAVYAQSPIFYIVDYIHKKYPCIYPSCEYLLGYNVEKIKEEGPAYFTSLWHPSDFKVYNEHIFPEIMKFISKKNFSSVLDYAFSFNFRLATNDGEYLTMLHRSTFFLAASDGTPLAAVGFIVDVSNFKEDNKMIFTIDKINRNFNAVSNFPIHRSVYFPQKISEVLSNRELQVLHCIYEGLSSKQIADKLCISLNTVNNHRKKMLEKTDCLNTADLIKYAIRQHIL